MPKEDIPILPPRWEFFLMVDDPFSRSLPFTFFKIIKYLSILDFPAGISPGSIKNSYICTFFEKQHTI